MLEVLKLIGFTLLFLRFAYWIGFSMQRSEAYGFRVFVAQFFEGMFVVFFFVQFFGHTPYLPMQTFLVVQSIGFALLLIGVGMTFVAKRQLGSEWVYAYAYTKQKGEQLVTNGMYSLIRHPLYTGIAVSYVGAELLAGSWLWVSMLFFFVPFYFQAKKEEKFLSQKFGKYFFLYKKKTKLFIPYLW